MDAPDVPEPRRDGSTPSSVPRSDFSGPRGVVPGVEMGRLLGITRQAVDRWRRGGRLIGLPLGWHGDAYPAWQGSSGLALPGPEAVLNDLGDHEPRMRVIFLLGWNDRPDGETPLAWLRPGDLDLVRRAARMSAEQGAA